MRTVTIPLEEYDDMKERDYFYREKIEEVLRNNVSLIFFHNGRDPLHLTKAVSTLIVQKSKTLAELDKSSFIKMLGDSLKSNKSFSELEIKILEK